MRYNYIYDIEMCQLFIQYFKNWRKQVFPPICIFLYVLFTGTDLCTTYCASPDLEFEINPVYLYFKWDWTGLLPYSLFMLTMTIMFAVISNRYIFKHFENKSHNISKNKFLFCIVFLLLVYCYHNLIAAFEVSINNYLNYRYLHLSSENKLQKIAISYVQFYIHFNERFGENYFSYIVTIVECLLATVVTIFQINRVKKYLMLCKCVNQITVDCMGCFPKK